MSLSVPKPLTGPSDRQTALWLILLSLAAALLRLLDIGRKSFWADEAFSITLAQLPWAPFRQIVLHNEANMALYYLLLRFWSQISDAPGYVRGLSMLAAVATVPVIYFAGRTLFSHRAGLIAAVLLTVNVFHIRYSREARSYSLVVLLVTCSCLLFVRNVESQGRFGGTGYVLASAAALYAHFFAVLVFMAQLVSWTLLPPPFRRWVQLRNLLIVALLGSPLMLFIASHGASPLNWVTHPSVKDAYRIFTSFSGSGLNFVLFLLALALAARQWWLKRGRDQSRLHGWAFVFVITWLLLPVVVTLLVSHWRPIFSPRFLLVCLPAALLLFAQGLALLRPSWLSCAVVVMVVVASLIALGKYDRQPDPSDWKGAISYLTRNAASGDALVFAEGYCRFPFDYNRRTSHIELPTMEVRSGLAGPASELAQARHVWVICANGNAPTIPGFRLVPMEHFRGVDIQEFATVSPASEKKR